MKKKKIMMVVVTVVAMSLLTGCAALMVPSPLLGIIYTDIDAPYARLQTYLEDARHMRVGTTECESFLGLIAVGDCSIKTAMDNGGITRIHHVDYHTKNIIGVYVRHTIIVHGQ
jgi:hypothetical protein